MTSETIPVFPSPWWLRARALWRHVARLTRRAPRRLRLRESLPLGEHRFVAVIEFERRRMLIGGTSSSLVLLAQLESDSLEDSRHGADHRSTAQGKFSESQNPASQIVDPALEQGAVAIPNPAQPNPAQPQKREAL